MKMIVHIVPLIGEKSEYGGPARGTLKQAAAQRERGEQVRVLSLTNAVEGSSGQSRWNNEYTQLYPSRRVPFIPGFAGLIAFSPFRWIWNNRAHIGIVHLHCGREVWPLMAALVLRFLGIDYIFQTHGMLSPRNSLATRVYDQMLTRWSVGGASAVLFLTNYEHAELSSWSWMPPLKQVVNGVDEIASSGPPSIDTPRMKVITTCRLHPRKRVESLIEAILRVQKDGVDAELTIFGPDEGSLTRCRELIAEAPALVRYGGALEYGQVTRELTRHNVYVLPSVNEPFPNSLLEGLAAGLICITTNSCGLAPYISEARAGIVCEPGADSIATALISVSELSAIERRRMSMRAIELCKNKFSMPAIVDTLDCVYQEVASKGALR